MGVGIGPVSVSHTVFGDDEEEEDTIQTTGAVGHTHTHTHTHDCYYGCIFSQHVCLSRQELHTLQET